MTGRFATTTRACDWVYAGEGGKHALFSYQPAPKPTSSLPSSSTKTTTTGVPPGNEGADSGRNRPLDHTLAGWLLRVRKEDLVRAATAAASNNETTKHQEQQSAGKGCNNESSWHRLEGDDGIGDEDEDATIPPVATIPRLRPYVDPPQTVRVPRDFLTHLRERTLTLSRRRIPAKRVPSWYGPPPPPTPSSSPSSQTTPSTSLPRGWLLPDYRIFSSKSACCCCCCCTNHDPRDPSRLRTSSSEEGSSNTDPDLSSRPSPSSACITVEIKPKAGYTAYSPLVHPKRRIKYKHSRFALLQKLYEHGRIAKDWETTTENATAPTIQRKISRYDPLDLFSNDTGRIKRALYALAECPQNNLKVWLSPSSSSSSCSYDQTPELWIGHKDDVALAQETASALATGMEAGTREMIRLDNDNGIMDDYPVQDFLKTNWMDLVAQILIQEEFLYAKLLPLQTAFDLLDGDGAILVYNHLVELCHGSFERADALIDRGEGIVNTIADSFDSSTTAPAPDTGVTSIGARLPNEFAATSKNNQLFHTIRRLAPVRLPQDTARIQRFCNHVESFRNSTIAELIQNQSRNYDRCAKDGNNCKSSAPNVGGPEQQLLLDEAYAKALEMVHGFDLDDCRYLLQVWLQSLVLNDISILVSIGILPTTCRNLQEGSTCRLEKACEPPKPKKQTPEEGGILHYAPPIAVEPPGDDRSTTRRNDRTTTQAATIVQYRLKVIDFDAKPAKKLKTRLSKEIAFDHLTINV